MTNGNDSDGHDHDHDGGPGHEHDPHDGPGHGGGGHAPTDVLTSSTDPATRYMYRAGRALVLESDLDLAWKHLSLAGAEEIERDQRLGLRIFETPRPDSVPELVDESAGRVRPLYVFALGWHIGCPSSPTPVSASAAKELQGLVPPPGQLDGVPVGLIDTGAAHHPWLDGRVERHDENLDVIELDKDGRVVHGAGHGSYAAGQIVRQAPTSKLVVLRAVTRHGLIDDVALARAVLQVADPRTKVGVITLPMNAYTRADTEPAATTAVLRELIQENPDLVVVAAAGNHSFDRPAFPAALKQVISVGALGKDGTPAYFTNHGWWVDACAVGADIEGAFLTGDRLLFPHTSEPRTFRGFARWSGTSFTAPLAAGAVAARMNRGMTGREAVNDLIVKPAKPRHVPGLGTRID